MVNGVAVVVELIQIWLFVSSGLVSYYMYISTMLFLTACDGFSRY
jgi:hypothetical protein